MKKQFILIALGAALSIGANAQSTTPVSAAATKTLSKEEKAKQKQQQEQDLNDAIKAVGLNPEQEKAVREALNEANAANKALKEDASLSDEQKTEAKQKINNAKNEKLRSIMGEEGYRKWNEIRKDQKARSGS